MPHILPDPEHPEVIWPEQEGVIGVVGVAPWATLDFCRKVYELTPAKKDWQYPRLLIDANTKIPSRGRHLELNERDPSPFINRTINELENSGATVAVVPCNTAHIIFERWSKPAGIPVLSIVDATVSAINTKFQRVAVLGSRYLMDSRVYHDAVQRTGRELIHLSDDEQTSVSELIGALKHAPSASTSSLSLLEELLNRLYGSGAECVVLACTELSILSGEPIFKEGSVVDSNVELAKAALRAISRF